MQQSSDQMMWTDFQEAMMWRLVVALAFLSGSSADVTCKNQNGNPVDWFILYKAENSLEYFYIDPTKAEWSSSSISDQNGCLGRTLEPYIIPPQNDETGFIAYNDQPPQKDKSQKAGQKRKADEKGSTGQKHGHSKGLIMMDDKTIVWLLHSTPNFPFSKTSFYPTTGKANAQTFICVTFDKAEAPKIAEHLWYIYPKRFDHRELSGYDDLFKDERKDPNTLSVLHKDLTSRGGKKFRSFVKRLLKDDAGPSSAKRPRNNNAPDAAEGDLYVTIAENIAGKYVTVQTWGKQVGRAKPYCIPNRKHVHNVKTVEISDNKKKKSWKNTHDHSKWCVSDKEDWTCFGDSNRSESQYKRPGGALCIKKKEVTDLFRGFIKEFEGCDDDTNPSSSN